LGRLPCPPPKANTFVFSSSSSATVDRDVDDVVDVDVVDVVHPSCRWGGAR
jgi:hypothetical protein